MKQLPKNKLFVSFLLQTVYHPSQHIKINSPKKSLNSKAVFLMQ